MKTAVAILFICAVTGAAGICEAGIIYSTLPAGNSYNQTNSYGMAGPTSPWGELDLAAAFTCGSITTTYLDSIDVALRGYSTGGATVDVMLAMDNGNERPGSILATKQITIPYGWSVATADFDNNVQLVAGAKYWVWMSVVGTGQSLWAYATPDTSGSYRVKHSSDSGASWSGYSYMPAFRVNGVPEPATIAILSLGGLMLARRRRA